MKEQKKTNIEFPYLKGFLNKIDEFESYALKFPAILNPLPYSFIKLMAAILFLCIPLIIFNVRHMPDSAMVSFLAAYLALFSNIVVFVWNQRYFVPKLFFNRKYVSFVLVNFLCLIVTVFLYQVGIVIFSKIILGSVISIYEVRESLLEVFLKFLVLNFFVCFVNLVLFVASVQGHLFYQQYIKKQTETDMKMDFLKRQLSPHFLFNSMNNIISMMDIDVKKSKMQMYDLVSILRTLLYENQEDSVSLGKEINFLKRFIELEKMRFDNSMEISFETNCENSSREIIPLLFLPLVENSFKHSLNIEGNSFIRIKVIETENSVTYSSENTNFPKNPKDKSSSGIGLQNLKRRLDLMYSGRYEYESFVEDNVYKVNLKILFSKKSD